jgi:hypothetical protein
MRDGVVYIASYKGPAEKFRHQLVHRLITTVTRSPYSHTELVLDGIGYSASERDGGVRKKEIDFYGPEWTYHPCSWVPPEKLLYHYNLTQNDKYDFLGLRVFLGIPAFEDPDKWWCSEWCSIPLGISPSRISPGALHLAAYRKEEAWQMKKIARTIIR